MSISRSYFDNNATTPVAPEVIDTLVEVLHSEAGNASSIHTDGQRARQLLESSRRQVAGALGARPNEIVFTSGGTESDNLAILGLVRQSPMQRKHVITTRIEHPAVLETCRQLERENVEVNYLCPVPGSGAIGAEDLRDHLRPETVLVSVMHANNETGAVQPIREIAQILKERKKHGHHIYFHSDGVQAFGKIGADVRELGVDLYSVSAHKCYAPKGTGALFVGKEVPLKGIQLGGRHERERRAGTENVAGAAAFARAIDMMNITAEAEHISGLRNRFESYVLNAVAGVDVNGDASHRLPNTSNLYFDGVEGEALVIALDLKGFAVSTGRPAPVDRSNPHMYFSLWASRLSTPGAAFASRLVDTTRWKRLRGLR